MYSASLKGQARTPAMEVLGDAGMVQILSMAVEHVDVCTWCSLKKTPERSEILAWPVATMRGIQGPSEQLSWCCTAPLASAVLQVYQQLRAVARERMQF